MADGLLDWLQSALGNVGQSSSPGTMPPDVPTAPMQPPAAVAPPPAPAPPPIGNPMGDQTGIDPMTASPPISPAAPPPIDPSTTDIAGGMQGAGVQPPAPVPMAPPAGAIPTMATPPTPPGAPMSLAPPAPGPSAPPSPNGFQAPPTGPGWIPDQQGKGGILARALGMSPDQGNQLAAKLGAGFTAAGNSAGKSPFQALASGAGAALEGGTKEQHQNTKDVQGYLGKAIEAKKAGDDAAYKTNYTQYLAAKLKSETDKAASKDAAGNKNDSPTQLYLSAQRLVQPERNALNKQIQKMQSDGAPPDQIAKAKAEGEVAINGKLNDHYSTLGIHPQTAAQLAQQPGNSQANPIDGKAMGLTKENAASKLQPGQYYTNPADGKLYQFKGSESGKGGMNYTVKPKSGVTPSTKPEPADPMKPEKGARMSMAGADDEE